MVGQTISHYEVMEELGHGGMGAVYKARDTLLNRILAIKILRVDIANPIREKRFIQEAQTASSLNHPNIVTIYEIFHVADSPCIAMEYITGQTLEQRLEQGPVDLRKGLEWAIAMSDALAKAHAAGVVHRDIKPANIMITSHGHVKVLDFGLAKLTQVSEDSDPGENLTQDGRIVGTPPYLSPEQAKGEKVDARSDIFSLGAMLFEMFSGKRPFERETNVEMLAAVVRDQPKKLRSVAKGLPAHLEKIISQCLEKRVDRRYQQMEELHDALDELRQNETLTRLLAAQNPPPFWRTPKAWMAAALFAIVAAGALVWWNWRVAPVPVAAPVLTRVTSDEGLTTYPAVSPDGKFVAYASDRGGESLDIWVQPAAGGVPVRLTQHLADDYEPAFSPDSTTIAFRSERDGGGVYLASILGGEQRLVAQQGRRPRFSPDGKWLAYWVGFSTGDPTSPGSNKVYIVNAGGGAPRQLVPRFESALYPVWSPNSKHILFLGASSEASSKGVLTGANRPIDRMDWWIAGLEEEAVVKTGAHDELTKQGLSVWASSGAGIAPDLWLAAENRIVFSASLATANVFRDSVNVWAVPLSSKNWKPVQAAQQSTFGTAFESRPAVSPSGDIFFSSAEVRTGVWMLPLDANQGKVTGDMKPLTRGAAFHGQPVVTPDGKKAVYFATNTGNMDIWIVDVATGKEFPLTSTAAGESAPQISADGSKVYYSIYGKREAYSIDSRGGEPLKICDDCGTWNVSRDGSKVLYWYSTAKPIVSIGMLSLPSGKKSEIIRHPEYSLYQPQFSPDDRWIAFLAKTGHDRSRIYVTPFDDATNWIPITDGENLDDKPRWSPDGSLIYFISERDGFRCIWAQRVDAATKKPKGEPFNVHHLHASRRSLRNVGLGPLEISVARNAMIFNLGEITGNIWRASRH